MFDSIEMGTDFCGQYGLGLILFDNVLIQIGYELLGFEIKIDGFPFMRRWLNLFRHGLLGHHNGRYDFYVITEFFRQELADFFFDLFWIGYFFVFGIHSMRL